MVCLPQQGDQTPTGETCYVGGWGALNQGGPSPTTINSVDVTIYSDDTCSNDDSYGFEFTPEFEVCAGKIEGGKDSCQGDSGGPLVCINGNNEPVLVGIVSWGYGCASEGYPGIYAETAQYIDWMTDIIGVTTARTFIYIILKRNVYTLYTIYYNIIRYKCGKGKVFLQKST